MTESRVRDKIQRATAEADAGRPWRAKEMLRGMIASDSDALEPDLLEAYGALLDSLGDRFEAGKYLFLSGRRRPEHEEAIAVFLGRTRRAHVNDLLAQFPKSILRRGLGNLPREVREQLEERGAPPAEIERRDPVPIEEPTWQDTALMVGCLGVVVVIVALAVVGTVTVARWAL